MARSQLILPKVIYPLNTFAMHVLSIKLADWFQNLAAE
jgi:hypothetical protein